MTHCDREKNLEISLSDVNESKDFDENINRYRVLRIGDLSVFISEKQAENLCEVVEKALYDEQTYEELVKENEQLISRIADLEERLQEQGEYKREHLSFQDVI
jgi:cell shape-determining protein MreC